MRNLCLVVLDGLGIAPPGEGNAFARADTPTLDQFFAQYPYTELDASGPAVGLPDGYIGNSEVGHLHLGAGRVIPQELVRINTAIAEDRFCSQDALQAAARYAREHDSTVHVMGIASDGGVHGHIDHIHALVRCFAGHDLDVKVHAFLDGRDVPPTSAARYLEELSATAAAEGTGEIASFMGRYYAMDRDQNWDRTERAYRALVHGEAHTTDDVNDGVQERYRENRNDYFIEPTIVSDSFAPVSEDDVVIFSNYRKDRARQLSAAFIAADFDRFETDATERPYFVSMMRYRDDFETPVVFERAVVEHTLGDILAEHGIDQLRLSESQKEPHITYFLNGQREPDLPGETVKVFPSAKIPSYDEKPEMEAEKITSYAVDAMADDGYGFIFINYPNADLVGHTGDIEAAIRAVETVDDAVSRLAAAARDNDYTLVLTSDHGTCETMLDEEGNMHTAHTLNKVPFCIVDDTLSGIELGRGGIANIAPTVLELMGINADDEMAASLIVSR